MINDTDANKIIDVMMLAYNYHKKFFDGRVEKFYYGRDNILSDLFIEFALDKNSISRFRIFRDVEDEEKSDIFAIYINGGQRYNKIQHRSEEYCTYISYSISNMSDILLLTQDGDPFEEYSSHEYRLPMSEEEYFQKSTVYDMLTSHEILGKMDTCRKLLDDDDRIRGSGDFFCDDLSTDAAYILDFVIHYFKSKEK